MNGPYPGVMGPYPDRLLSAELRLLFIAAARGARGVEEGWLCQIRRYTPGCLPDALYIDTGDASASPLLFDVERDRIMSINWIDWRDQREDELFDYESYFE